VLPIIVHQSVQLVKFIAALGLALKPAALQHVTNIADELVVASERRKKTLSALNRQQVEPPTDEYAVADCFRQSPWQAADVRQAVLVFLVKFAIELARRLKLDQLIWISFDDSLCEKDPNTEQLEAVDWHHDHNARAKRQASYKKGSVYVLCRIQIGFIQFTVNWRLYLREKTVRQINKGRARAERVQYMGKTDLALQMLAELQALLPTDFKVYVLFDSWYSSHEIIGYIHQQGWHAIGGLKSNRTVNGKQVQQWFKQQRPKTKPRRVRVTSADGKTKTYWVHSLVGRLSKLPFDVCVLVSLRHPGDKSPAYFFCTDLSLALSQVLAGYGHRWPCEVDNWYLKVQLGLADYQMQTLNGILRWHAVVFLTLAYLQWRQVQVLAQPHAHKQPTLADMIETHHHEHIVQWLKTVAECAIQSGSVGKVLRRFAGASPQAAAT
jgi:hypothetical protein